MGNFRSSRWRNHQKKTLVEDCLQLDVRDTTDDFLQLAVGRGSVPLRTYLGESVSQPQGQLFPLKECGRLLMFCLEFTNGSVWQAIRVLTSTQESDRSEPVFECPADGCDKRARKLYMPLGRTQFLCRACHNLTYRSQQEHDPRITRLKKDPDQLIELLNKLDLEQESLPKLRLLMRAGRSCISDLEAKLPPTIVEAVNTVFLAGELARYVNPSEHC